MHRFLLSAAVLLVSLFSSTTMAGEAYVVLVDRSGSMQGGKMTNTKAALTDVFGRLDDDDRVAIVAFDDAPLVLLADGSPDDAEAMIAGLYEGGGTDLQPAMEVGAELLTAIRQTHGDLDAHRMIVMTDGQAAYGTIRDLTKQLHDDGVVISTVALGRDADTVLLDMIAGSGGGVATRANAQDVFAPAIAEAFGLEGLPYPVEVEPEAATTAWVFVLDASPSIGELGATMLREAVAGVQAELGQETDRIALLAIGETPFTLLANGSPHDAAEAIEHLALLAGESDLADALDAAHTATLELGQEHENLQRRRVVLVSDGGPANAERIARVCADLAGDQTAVTTVAIGEDADREVLAEIARLTGGAALRVDAMAELPEAIRDATLGSDAERDAP